MAATTQGAPRVSADRGRTLATLWNLWPYMWPSDRPDLKRRVLVAFLALIAAKVFTVLVPYFFAWATDALTGEGGAPAYVPALVAGPVMLVLAYNAGRIVSTTLNQVRDALFAARRAARGAPARLPHLRPPPPAVAALSSRAAHGRAVAHRRARHDRHRDDRPLHHPEQPADRGGVRPDRRRHLVPVRRLVRRRDRGDGVGLCVVHGARQRLAHRHPPRDERFRHGRPFQGGRLAAQLRDGQIFRQRGPRGGALRPLHGALRARRRAHLDLARLAEFRPDRDLLARHGGVHGPLGARRHGGDADDRRLRADQRALDAALHPAELHRLRLSRDQAGPRRHRGDVPPARSAGRGDRPPRRAGARRHAAAPSASRTCISPTTRRGRS